MIFEYQPSDQPSDRPSDQPSDQPSDPSAARPAQSLDPLRWHILLVDDDEDDYLITQSHLNHAGGRKVDLDWAATYEAGLDCLHRRLYDAVLVDYDLGRETGITFIRQATHEQVQAPLILYTGRGGYKIDLEAMEVGATLYLTKVETNPLLLERSIRYAIERKQAERALRDSEERYRSLFVELEQRVQQRTAELKHTRDLFERLFHSAPDATLIVDAQGRIERINRQVELLFGYQEHELLGESIERLTPARFRNLHALFRSGYTLLPSVRRMGERPDILGLRKNGEEFLVDVMLSPVEIDGEVHVICVVREILKLIQQ